MLGEWPVNSRQGIDSMFVNLNLYPKGQWRGGKSIPNCFWAVYFSADFDRVKKILLALGRADFTLNILNVFIQTGLRDEKIIQKDTEAHQEQLLSEKS